MRLLLQRREDRRRQKVIFNALDNRLLRLSSRALGDPLRVRLECVPLLLALRETLPLHHVGERVIARTDQRGPEADLLNAVFLEESERDAGKAIEQRRQTRG